MKLRLFILLCSLFSFSVFASGEFSDNGRVLIVQTIGAGMHRYSVRIPGCGKTINNFRIQVDNGALKVSAAGVGYSNGQSNSVSAVQTFDAGYVSPWIALENFSNGTGCVNQLFVDAEAVDARHPARLTLYGAKM